MDCVVNCIEVVLLSELSKLELTLCCTVLSIDSHLEILLCAVSYDFTEKLCELGSVLSFLKTSLLPVHTDFRIAFPVSNSCHCKIHTDLCALAFEVSLKTSNDLSLNFFGDISTELLANTYDVLSSPNLISLLLRELASGNLTLRTELRRILTFINITTNWANPFLHDCILLYIKIFFI